MTQQALARLDDHLRQVIEAFTSRYEAARF